MPGCHCRKCTGERSNHANNSGNVKRVCVDRHLRYSRSRFRNNGISVHRRWRGEELERSGYQTICNNSRSNERALEHGREMEEQMIIKSVKLENWAKNQKRVTNGRIRKEFNVNEERAQVYYDYLKSTGIVGSMGYVNHEKY